MTVREFLKVLRQRWRWIVAVFSVVVAAAAVSILLTPKTYSATARFYLSASGGASGGAIQRGDLSTYAQVVSAPSVQEQVRSAAKVPADAPIGLTATLSDTANIMAVTADSDTPEHAAALANATGPALAAVAPRFSQLLVGGSSVISTTVEPASAPSSPSSPDVRRTLGLAIVLGLLLGVSVAVLRHVLDNRVRTVDDLERLVHRPVLSTIPQREGKDAVIDLSDAAAGPIVEAIRRLRTNVRFTNVTNDVPAVVITSADPGDGKTTVATNLAIAMARDGYRTLLIDADLRKPDVASVLDIDGTVGLTSVLVGEVDLKDALVEPSPLPLYVLPAGPVPPNASELLGSAPMRELFASMVKEFDFVVLDSPPLLPVVDALTLEQLAGNLVLVVRSGQVTRREVQAAMKALTTVEASVAGTVLNFVPSNSADYGYGYGYGYGGGSDRKAQRRDEKRRKAARKVLVKPESGPAQDTDRR